MISSDLLFQVDPIYIISPMRGWYFLCIAFIAGLSSLILYGFFRMKEMKASRIIDTKFILPDINDIDFEEKISQTIRNSIGCGVPYPDALTAREILNIKKQHTLLPLLQNIEKKEYIGEVLDTAEREKTLDILRNKI